MNKLVINMDYIENALFFMCMTHKTFEELSGVSGISDMTVAMTK